MIMAKDKRYIGFTKVKISGEFINIHRIGFRSPFSGTVTCIDLNCGENVETGCKGYGFSLFQQIWAYAGRDVVIWDACL